MGRCRWAGGQKKGKNRSVGRSGRLGRLGRLGRSVGRSVGREVGR